MHIFISWSGERSRFVAETLREWIPYVIQSAKPWISSKDIFAGEDWNKEINEKLGEFNFGIICLTPENLQSPWIHFEAGALSCQIKDKTLVCPYLVDLEPKDVAPPLSRFQLTKANKEGTLKIVESINRAIEESPLDKLFLDETFNLWWPKLEEKLKNLPSGKNENSSKSERNEKEILIEILETVRSLSTQYTKHQHITLNPKSFSDTEVDSIGNSYFTPRDVAKLIANIRKTHEGLNDPDGSSYMLSKFLDCQSTFDDLQHEKS